MQVSAIPCALAASLFLSATPAQAAVSGASATTEWTMRAGTSTTSAAVLKVKAFGKGKPDRIPCWTDTCGGQVNGGSYRCTSGGAKHNTWTPLRWEGKKRWVADQCVGFGRIA